MQWRVPRFWLAAGLLLALSSACKSSTGTVCTTELRIALSPRDTSIAVAAGFNPTIALSSCGGSRPINDVFAWTAVDTTVVRVTPTTGRTIGLKPGVSAVQVKGQQYGQLGSVTVTVRASP